MPSGVYKHPSQCGFQKGHLYYLGTGEEHPRWQGEKVGYTARHYRIYTLLGKANHCEMCQTKYAKKYEWANKSKEYRYDKNDWISLCSSCHKKYDKIHLKRKRDKLGRFI